MNDDDDVRAIALGEDNEIADITVILDSSGSMQSCVADVLGGFNALVADQRKQPGLARLTLVRFADNAQVIYDAVGLDLVPPLTHANYQPGGGTALLDAMHFAITRAMDRIEKADMNNRPSRVVVAVITDGDENQSRHVSRSAVMKLVGALKEQGWLFLFIGADQDAIGEAAKLGIDAQHALHTTTHDPDAHVASYAAVSSVMGSYRISSGDAKVASASAGFSSAARAAAFGKGARRPSWAGPCHQCGQPGNACTC